MGGDIKSCVTIGSYSDSNMVADGGFSWAHFFQTLAVVPVLPVLVLVLLLPVPERFTVFTFFCIWNLFLDLYHLGLLSLYY